MTEPPPPRDVFISHASEDIDVAREIRQHLEAAGHSCWLTSDDAQGSGSWASQAQGAIESCTLLLVVMSTATNGAAHVSREVDLAIERTKPLLPVRIEDVEPTGSLNYLLRLAQWVDCFPGPIADHSTALMGFVGAIVGLTSGREPLIAVSCPKRDAAVARAAVDAIEAASMRCWYAPRDLDPAVVEWSEKIDDAIDASDALVVVLSRSTGRSSQIAREVSRAVAGGKEILTIRTYEPNANDAIGIEDPTTGEVSRAWWKATLAAPGIDVRRGRTKRSLNDLVAMLSPDSSIAQQLDDKPEFDVFISYRRGEGAEVARLMQLKLKERDINAFLDVDDLRPGHFDEALLTQIENAPSFLLVLSEGALDRCSAEDDWLRREITHALATNRTVIPLLTPRFEFPTEDELPADIRPILVHHGVTYSHEFLDAALDKIASYLDTHEG